MTYWLGIDSGGTFIKAALYTKDGEQVALARRNLAVISTHPGEAERDPALFRTCCYEVIAELSHQVPPKSIRAVGISAQGKGLFTLDRQGNVLGNGILSSDQRAIEVVKHWLQQGVAQELYAKTRQTLWTGHPVSILRALKIQSPQRYEQIGSILMSHDYLRYCLTGNITCEETNISESNLYNFAQGGYDPTLAEYLDIAEIIPALSPIIASTEIAGSIHAEAAEKTGLQVETPVVGGLFDVVATAISAGLTEDHLLNVVLGTWSVVSGFTHQIDDSQTERFVYGKTAQAGQYIVHEASPTSAANLEHILHWTGDTDYNAINQMVDALPKGESSVLFVPFFYGSNAGLGMQAGLYGLQAYHHKAHIYQAVYEGVIFCLMQHLLRMEKRFPHVKRLRVTGGPTRSSVWMQMLADISGKTVETLSIEETGCLGAALTAMVGTGAYPDIQTARKALSTQVNTYHPNKQLQPLYQKKYQRYQDLITSLQSYHHLN